MNLPIHQRKTRIPFLKVFGCALGLSIAAGVPLLVHSEPSGALPKPDYHHFHEYLSVLETSPLPAAKAIRDQIAAGPARLAEERTAARREGIPLETNDLKRPSPPPNDDAGPLYVQLENSKDLDRVQFPYYADCLTFGYSYTPEQIKDVQMALNSEPRYMAVLHQATDRPYCSFYRKPDYPAEPLSAKPSYALLRMVSRQLVTESYLLAHDGHYPEAINDGVRGLRVAQHAGSDVGLMGFLVAPACEAITLSNMRSILWMAGPNAAVDRQVQEAVAKHRPHVSLHDSLATDVPFSLYYFEHARKGGPQESAKFLGMELEVDTDKGSTIPDKQFLSPEDGPLLANLLAAQEAGFIHHIRLLVRAAALPPLERHRQFTLLSAPEPDSPASWWSNTFDYLSGLDDIDNRMHADEEVTMAAAAILSIRGETGAFPTQLPGTFTDAFNGKPLGYRQEGADGFVIYSVGKDRNFDGGQPGQPHKGISFRYPPPPLKPLPPPPNPNSGYPSGPPLPSPHRS